MLIFPSKMKAFSIQLKIAKSYIDRAKRYNFSCSTLFYMKSKVFLKFFIHDCSSICHVK